MNLTASAYVSLAVASIRDPRAGARAVMGVPIERALRWQALILVVLLSAILGELTVLLVPDGADPLMGGILVNPVVTAFIQLSLLVVTVHAIYWIGHAAGGNADFDDTILAVAWMQAILVGVQALQALSLIVMPPLASLLGMFGIGVSLWLLTGFVAELHGFRSLGRVFLAILAAVFGMAFGLSLILAMIGIAVPGN